ncbi:phosphoribosylformylglycinamidine cyclo-ligase [Candidatus Pelagibacter sp.]|nr:phosphoribosylformylglycinamidine cyclo-ligase [Candidatus Pelagibacter sp.]
MKKYKFTYQNSGVNINAADNFVQYIANLNNKKRNAFNNNNIGSFASITAIPKGIKKPLLVSSTDGVGTKIEIANKLKKFDTIGIDLVAMCVNDILVQGAKPLIFLDYISIDKVNLTKLKNVIKGIQKGCQISECSLVGGETAEMPGTYSKGKFDLAGFSLGIVESKKLFKKSSIKENDIIMAIPSNGLHSNGYSLVRDILSKKKININKNFFLKKELLKPTKIYVKEILSLIRGNLIHGCAHITGGGLPGNLTRIIPNNICANIGLDKIKVKPIFKWIKKKGVSDIEMLKTFNLGVGFCFVTKKRNIKKVEKYFNREYKPYVIGEFIKNKKNKILFNEKIKW